MSDIFDYTQPMTAYDLVGWRDEFGVTQIQAGLLLGVSERTICYYESGKRPIPLAVQISCEFYRGCSKALINDIIEYRGLGVC